MSWVGLDQSFTAFGITFLKKSGDYDTIVQKFDPKKDGSGVTRLLAIEYWLREQIVSHDLEENITHICMEGYAAGSKFGREKAGELGAVVKMSLYNTFYDLDVTRFPTIVAPTSLKKFVTGKGVAKKNEMLLNVYKKWSADFTDDNAADSYGLAQIAKSLDTGKTAFKYEEEVINKLTKFTERFEYR